jgi:hypothetical protein
MNRARTAMLLFLHNLVRNRFYQLFGAAGMFRPDGGFGLFAGPGPAGPNA